MGLGRHLFVLLSVAALMGLTTLRLLCSPIVVTTRLLKSQLWTYGLNNLRKINLLKSTHEGTTLSPLVPLTPFFTCLFTISFLLISAAVPNLVAVLSGPGSLSSAPMTSPVSCT